MGEASVTPGGAPVPAAGMVADEGLAARSMAAPASETPMAMVQAAPVDPGLQVLARPRPSFEELYTSSYQSLVRLAFVLTSSIELSEDIVQDCFVRLHRHYDRLETPERYAKQAVVNACRSHFRKIGRERDKRPLLYVVDGEESASGAGAHPGELHDVLLRLPYRQRAAVVLRFYADLSEIEIAEVLGCAPGTVGSLIHRALERLRGVLEQ